ncbi:D-tyrosyl-tRNA(Tyr) deacylase [Oceanobacillus piezotolerans]|uniref:D-aminoacyl-tRNA deacylase n=1 Tax=Oceanobacillus piezotolerans TaxID=2448030 RepID=A0A498DLS4_9BACI|nr:D-aminoacyl-tRNA deacylase [Oceanobacillus piezotolerans]RLL47990.1 D-tyrosyl-tRNA(Tyr) deacylase [Oceanobacillus piezotolerans]
MKAVIQRARNANVKVDGKVIGDIKHGFVILLGITHDDNEEDVDYLVKKIIHLRVFEDDNEKMNHSLLDVNGEVLSISQFTLYADTKKGRRPSFIQAAKPEEANILYEQFNEKLRAEGIVVETGQFGAMMDVTLTNDGPVTLIIDSKEK